MKYIKSYRVFESDSLSVAEMLELGLLDWEDIPGLINNLDRPTKIELVKPLIEKYGFREVWRMFGDETIREAYGDTPELYLDRFDSLTRIDGTVTTGQAEISFQDKDGNNIFFYYPDNTSPSITVSYYEIWLFFQKVCNMGDVSIQSVLANWLHTRFGIDSVDPQNIGVFF